MEKKRRTTVSAERRSPDNSDLSIIMYRLDELVVRLEEQRQLIENSLNKQDSRVTALETRVGAIEIFRASIEERFKKSDGNNTDNYLKIIFIVLGLLGTALGIVSSGALKGIGG